MAKSFQTQMSTKHGNVPMLNAYGQIANMAWYPKFTVKTADYTVTAADSGTVFLTTGATGTVVFTLPAIADGPFYFKFIAVANYTMTVAAATADTMLSFNDTAVDSITFSTTSEIMGGTVEVYCDGTTLIGLPRLAVEAQTPTITS